MFYVTKTLEKANKFYGAACRGVVAKAERHSSALMFAFGAVLLVGGMTELASAQGAGSARAYGACSILLAYMETGFGALVASAAGVGAIISAAVGGFKAAWSLLVVSIGAFILRAYITLFNAGC